MDDGSGRSRLAAYRAGHDRRENLRGPELPENHGVIRPFFRRPTEVARRTGQIKKVDESKYGDMATMTEAMDWDDEAQAEALFQARQMQVRDPEGAAMLLATLVITQDLQEQQGEPVERGG